MRVTPVIPVLLVTLATPVITELVALVAHKVMRAIPAQ
jgi:hypothetical protein